MNTGSKLNGPPGFDFEIFGMNGVALNGSVFANIVYNLTDKIDREHKINADDTIDRLARTLERLNSLTADLTLSEVERYEKQEIENGNVRSIICKNKDCFGCDYLRVDLYMEMFRERGIHLIYQFQYYFFTQIISLILYAVLHQDNST
ncbi:hypothetical protein AGMMS49975_26590 [Clostridia bacterium]|nr:hypothetical protein AGMMS49975_26590 [Clostridia bacterium]